MGLAPGSLGVGAASEVARAAYAAMITDAAFRAPLAWSAAAEERAHGALRAEAAALARAGAGAGAAGGSGGSGGSASARRAARVAKRSGAGSGSGVGTGQRGSTVQLRAMRAAGIVDGRLLAPVAASVTGGSSDVAGDGSWDDDHDHDAHHRHDDAAGLHGADGSGGASGSAARLFVPEAVDGLVIVGAYPAAAHDRLWDDADLRGAVARFWGAEKPLAVFGSAVLLLARLHYASDGLPLLWGRMATALPESAERCNALLHALCGCVCAGACGSGTAAGRVPRAPLPRGALAAREASAAGPASGTGSRLVGSTAPGAAAGGGVDADASIASWGGGGGSGEFDTSATSAAAAAGAAFGAGAGSSGGHVINGAAHGGLVVFPSVEAEVRSSLRLPGAMFVPAPPLLCSPQACAALCIRSDFAPVRPADPLRPETAVVVEDGALFTAQGGGDAFVLAHRFLAKLEQVQRSF